MEPQRTKRMYTIPPPSGKAFAVFRRKHPVLSSEDDERAILSVKTRCSSGTIDWTSAYGAIRIEVNPYLRGDFRFCFVAQSRHTVSQVSQETSSRSRSRQRNYRLGLEEEEGELRSLSMTPLVQTSGREEGEESREVCVLGRREDGGQSLWLFVELERTNRFTGIPSVTLRYDVEPLTTDNALLLDPLEECRPCSQEELLEAYCTSDFVAVGSIHETHHPEEDQEHTHITIAAAQLVHQTHPVFQRLHRDDRFLYGTVRAPAKCGIRQGQGSFLFTGRMRLGKPKLRCAPFYEDWLKISKEAECVF
ncbi:hypothetical protein ACOMHN_066243 [Nucella lapillus]